MTEEGVRAVTLLQAFETVEPPLAAWGDADRVAATRAAREAVGTPPGGDGRSRAGSRSPRDAAVAIERRARLGLARLAAREPGVEHDLRHRPARSGARRATLVVASGLAFAFVAGLVADAIGAAQRIDLLAPPFWGVIAWNLVVYGLLVLGLLRRPARAGSQAGPLRRALHRIVEVLGPAVPSGAPSPAASEPAWRAFRGLWRARRAPLALARLGAALHAAAALFALGLIVGLYLRGLVLDYRVGWESTFLDAGAVHRLLGMLLAPAARVDGLPLPDEATVAALRGVHGAAVGGTAAVAAPWIHLLATTLALVVVLPRAALAALGVARAAWRRRHLALPIAGDAYLERLARELTGRVVVAQVLPYAAAPGPAPGPALAAALRAEWGDLATVRLAAPTRYGDEDAPRPPVDPATTHLVALFDLAATPEAEAHGRFVATLTSAAPETSTLVVVDETRFARRFAADPARRAERRALWQRFADDLGVPARFVELGIDARGVPAAGSAPLSGAAAATR